MTTSRPYSEDRPLRPDCGVTLVQVMVAATLLTTVVGGALAGLLQARYLARAAAHRVHALQICRANLEALRYSYGYADALLTPNATHTNMPSDVPQIISVGGKILQVHYTPSYTVTETSLGGGIKYKTVRFTVAWSEPALSGMIPQTVIMNTVISLALDR